MSSNAVALRRIIRSLGHHATPRPLVAEEQDRKACLGRAHRIAKRSSSSGRNQTASEGRGFKRVELVRDGQQHVRLDSGGDLPRSDQSYRGLAPHITDSHHRQARSVQDDARTTRGHDAGYSEGSGGLQVGQDRSGSNDGGDGLERSGGVLRDETLETQTGPARQRTHTEDAGTPSDTPEAGGLRIRRELGGLKPRVPPTAFELAVRTGAPRGRDARPEVSPDGTAAIKPFRDYYWKNLAFREAGKARARAEQARIERVRHPINEHRAWKDILKILSSDTSEDGNVHARVMETIMLPPGISARWTGDPGESILQIMQHTGSHVQSLPGFKERDMPGLTLYGTAAQNEAATRYLRGSDLLYASSKMYDDVSPSLSAHDLHKVPHVPGGEMKDQATHDDGSQTPDDDLALLNSVLDATYLERADPIDPSPARAVWHRGQSDIEIPLSTLLGTERKGDGTPFTNPLPSLPGDPVSFTNRIGTLTAYRPRLLKYKSQTESRTPHHFAIRAELVRLIKIGFEQNVVTMEAVVTALDWLGRHMYFPSIREIVLAADQAKFNLSPEVFDAMLRFAVKSPSVDNFRYLVRFMHRAGGKATTMTWLHFEQLTWRHNRERVEQVRKAMLDAGVQYDKDAELELFKQDTPRLLARFVEQRPDSTFSDFVQETSSLYPDIKRMGRRGANSLVDTALSLGRSDLAFGAVHELLRQGETPNTATLDHFLHSARRNRHVESAVAILSAFVDMSYQHTAKTETSLSSIHDDRHNAEHGNLLFVPRVRAFSIVLSASSFRWLLWLSWDRRMWNCFRVFWRYACMAGHVDFGFVAKMKASLRAGRYAHWDPSRRSDTPIHAPGPGVSSFITARTRVWDVWAARFALGSADGLERWDEADVAVRSSAAAKAGILQAKPKAITDWFERLDMDLAEVQSLKPVRPIAEIAEEAYRMDLEWRKQNFGTTKGLTEGKWRGTEMLAVMMKEGIQVPVEVGSGVGMTL